MSEILLKDPTCGHWAFALVAGVLWAPFPPTAWPTCPPSRRESLFLSAPACKAAAGRPLALGASSSLTGKEGASWWHHGSGLRACPCLSITAF